MKAARVHQDQVIQVLQEEMAKIKATIEANHKVHEEERRLGEERRLENKFNTLDATLRTIERQVVETSEAVIALQASITSAQACCNANTAAIEANSVAIETNTDALFINGTALQEIFNRFDTDGDGTSDLYDECPTDNTANVFDENGECPSTSSGEYFEATDGDVSLIQEENSGPGDQSFNSGILYDAVRDYYVNCALANSQGCASALTYGYPINAWCVGAVTSMNNLFSDFNSPVDMTGFNEDISNWDVSSVETMASM